MGSQTFREGKDLGDHLSEHSPSADEKTGAQRSPTTWPKSHSGEVSGLSQDPGSLPPGSRMLSLYPGRFKFRKLPQPPHISSDLGVTEHEPRAPRLLFVHSLLLSVWSNRREDFCWDLIWKVLIIASGTNSPPRLYELKPASACIWMRTEMALTHLSEESRLLPSFWSSQITLGSSLDSRVGGTGRSLRSRTFQKGWLCSLR